MAPVRFLPLLAVAALVGCGSSNPPARNATEPPGPDDQTYLTVDNSGSDYVDGPMDLGAMRLHADVCNGLPELRPEFKPLTENDLMAFLKAQGFNTRAIRARSDLVYVEITNPPGGGNGDFVRLRVAILPTPYDAGNDLHEAILQHGAGSWGVHRSNLAVLAPIGSPSQVVGFAVKTKLACWGVLTMSARDDDFVVAGGYTEL